jgi:hypothetical protein
VLLAGVVGGLVGASTTLLLSSSGRAGDAFCSAVQNLPVHEVAQPTTSERLEARVRCMDRELAVLEKRLQQLQELAAATKVKAQANGSAPTVAPDHAGR